MIYALLALNICLCTTLYFLARLFWLKHFQMVVLLRSPHIYMKMPPLKYMMWKKFWVWEDTVFLPNPEELTNDG